MKITITAPENDNRLDILIMRQYNTHGTNGLLYINGEPLCNTIELPWKENQQRISCIPEGKYQLQKRHTTKYGDHLEVLNVKDREYILIHAANNALKELEGCIAPVTTITGPGTGTGSRIALKKILDAHFKAFVKQKQVFLTITCRKSVINDAKALSNSINIYKQR